MKRGPARAKLTEQLTLRVDEELVARVDAYIEKRYRAARVVLSRSMAVREILGEHLPSPGVSKAS